MYPSLGGEPRHKLAHQVRHVARGRRRVDGFARGRVDNVVLHLAVLSRRAAAAPDAFDEPLVDFADQPLGNGGAAGKIVGDELEGRAIIEQLAGVVGIDVFDGLSFEQSPGLVERQSRALDVRGVMRLQDQRPMAHFHEPLV